MIYSVFNWNTGKYDYFKGNGDKFGNRPKPSVVINKPNAKFGVPVESVLPVVPSSVIKIGSGKVAKGRIAIHPSQRMSPSGQGGGVLDSASGLGATESLVDNPLVVSPWITLGLWFGAFFVGLRVISYIAKE